MIARTHSIHNANILEYNNKCSLYVLLWLNQTHRVFLLTINNSLETNTDLMCRAVWILLLLLTLLIVIRVYISVVTRLSERAHNSKKWKRKQRIDLSVPRWSLLEGWRSKVERGLKRRWNEKNDNTLYLLFDVCDGQSKFTFNMRLSHLFIYSLSPAYIFSSLRRCWSWQQLTMQYFHHHHENKIKTTTEIMRCCTDAHTHTHVYSIGTHIWPR